MMIPSCPSLALESALEAARARVGHESGGGPSIAAFGSFLPRARSSTAPASPACCTRTLQPPAPSHLPNHVHMLSLSLSLSLTSIKPSLGTLRILTLVHHHEQTRASRCAIRSTRRIFCCCMASSSVRRSRETASLGPFTPPVSLNSHEQRRSSSYRASRTSSVTITADCNPSSSASKRKPQPPPHRDGQGH